MLCLIAGSISANAESAGDPLPTDFRSPFAAQDAALVLGGGAPNAVFLVRSDGELQAGLLGGAGATELLGSLDLLDRSSGHADGEENFRIKIETRGVVTPLQVVPMMAGSEQSDDLSLGLV